MNNMSCKCTSYTKGSWSTRRACFQIWRKVEVAFWTVELEQVGCDGRITLILFSCLTFVLKGIWLTDLAKIVPPTVELHGCDMTSAKYPAQELLPPNIHMHVESVLSLPEKWTNHFDLIHQRFLVGALRRDKWPVALSELFRTLKPGGSVQLVENLYTCTVESGPIKRHFEIFDKVFAAHGLVREIAIELPQFLQEAGYVDITWEEKIVPTGNAKEWGPLAGMAAASHMRVFRDTGKLVVAGGFVGSQEEYDEITDGVEREWAEKGEHLPCRIICARKPL